MRYITQRGLLERLITQLLLTKQPVTADGHWHPYCRNPYSLIPEQPAVGKHSRFKEAAGTVIYDKTNRHLEARSVPRQRREDCTDCTEARGTTPNRRVADEAAEVMTHWVASIADQVKNPIAGIAAAVDIVERHLGEQGNQSSANSVTDSRQLAETAISMMRSRLDLLDRYVSELAGIARAATIRQSELPAAAIMNEIHRDIVARIGSGIDVSLGINPATTSIFGDPEKIASMCNALVTNAIESVAPDQRPIVVISVAPGLDAKGRSGVVIRVSDNGCGIPRDNLENVTRPFFSTKEAGTGLGLTLCEKYVQAHHGSLDIASSRDLGGTSVSLFFPNRP